MQKRLQHFTLGFFTRQGPYQLSSQIWMKNICKKATKQEFNWRVFFQCFDYFKKVAMVTVRYLHLYNFLVPASRRFWILRFLAFIWCMMLLVLPPVRVPPKIWSFAATLLTLPMLRLLSSKAQGRKDFWKSPKPCHVGIHRIALAENSDQYPCARVF